MNDFMLLVKRMRAAQRDYFKTRDHVDLHRAKQLERDVDTAIKSAESITAQDGPGLYDLFDTTKDTE